MNATKITTDEASALIHAWYAKARWGELDRDEITAALAPLGTMTLAEVKIVAEGFEGYAYGATRKALVASMVEAIWKRGYLISRNECIRNA